MADVTIFGRIVVSKDVMHGKPRVAGTRVTVVQVLELLAGGKTIDTIVSPEYYPELTEVDVLACLAYASHVLRDERIIPTA
jgi:uncharacterized protein (DUF433 family)